METAFSAKLPFCTNREVLLHRLHSLKQLLISFWVWKAQFSSSTTRTPPEIPKMFPDRLWCFASSCAFLNLETISYRSGAMPLIAYTGIIVMSTNLKQGNETEVRAGNKVYICSCPPVQQHSWLPASGVSSIILSYKLQTI